MKHPAWPTPNFLFRKQVVSKFKCVNNILVGVEFETPDIIHLSANPIFSEHRTAMTDSRCGILQNIKLNKILVSKLTITIIK